MLHRRTNANWSPLHGTIYRAYDLTSESDFATVATAPISLRYSELAQLVNTAVAFFMISKLIAAFILIAMKQ